MKKVMGVIFLSWFIMGPAFAKKNKGAFCVDIKSCVEKVGGLTGKQYMYPDKMKGKITLSKNFKINKENAEYYLSEMLASLSYTSVPMEDGSFRVIDARDVRYSGTPKLYGTREVAPIFPRTNDYHFLSYQFSNPSLANEVTRSLRPFLSRYARVITFKGAGIILLQDRVGNLKRMYDLVKKLDQKPSSETAKRNREQLEHHRRVELAKAASCQKKRK